MSTDLGTYREQSLATWGEVAPGWEDRREWLMNITGRVSAWLVAKADPQPGETFLEIAAGTGDLGFAVAEHVGEGGHLILSDFSSNMLDVARRNGEARGLTQVEYRVIDAENMSLDDDSVDGAVCRWGYMLMADPAAALRETRRVLRSGGPLAFAVWRTPDRNPWAAIPAITLVQRGRVPPPEPGAPGMFALGDPEPHPRTGDARRVRRTGARGDRVRVQLRLLRRPWDSLVRLAGPFARAIKALSDGEREATRAAIEQNVEPYRNQDGSYTGSGGDVGSLTR